MAFEPISMFIMRSLIITVFLLLLILLEPDRNVFLTAIAASYLPIQKGKVKETVSEMLSFYYCTFKTFT